MKQELLAQFPVPMVVGLAVFIFLTVFIGLLFWVFRKGSSKVYSEVEQLPLREGSNHAS